MRAGTEEPRPAEAGLRRHLPGRPALGGGERGWRRWRGLGRGAAGPGLAESGRRGGFPGAAPLQLGAPSAACGTDPVPPSRRASLPPRRFPAAALGPGWALRPRVLGGAGREAEWARGFKRLGRSGLYRVGLGASPGEAQVLSVAAAGSGCDKPRVGVPGSPRSPGPARRRGSTGGCPGSWRSCVFLRDRWLSRAGGRAASRRCPAGAPWAPPLPRADLGSGHRERD